MPTVSLITVGQALGRVSSDVVSLATLRANGYSRTFGASGYLRVNPFEVEQGAAADPDDGVSGVHSLAEWYGYSHSSVPAGSQLAATSSYGDVILTWTSPSGYSRAPSILDQRIYAKDTGETAINGTSLSVNPFSSADQQQSAGDGSGDTIDLSAFEGQAVAIGVKAEFNDSVSTHTASDGNGYAGAAGQDILIGGGAGVCVIVFATNPGPVSCTQTTDPDSCTVGDNVTLNIQCNMQGSSTGRLEESVDGGGFSLVDAAVSAGTTSINVSRQSGHTYQFRLRYNDVSPDTWATQTGSTSATCNLI